MSQWTRASLIFASVTLFAIGACSEDDPPQNNNPAPAGSGGQAGSAGSAGEAGAGAGATGGSGGTSGSGGSAGSSGSGASGGSSNDAAVDAPVGSPRPILPDSRAPDFSVLKYLEKAGSVTAPVTDGWDPTAGIGDVASFTPTYTVAATGGTHTTVQSAVDSAAGDGGTGRIYIRVLPGTYREFVCVPFGARPITLYGTGAQPSDTVIVFNNYSGKMKPVGQPGNPCSPSTSSGSYGTSGSATFAAYSNDFQAKNLTFSNDTDETGITSNAQGVALMTQGDKLVFENVRVLGNQDSLYVKTLSPENIARAYFKSSYVEGDVDFIFGRGTFVLDGCEIKQLTARQKTGNALAPSTDARNPYGILVINSTFTADTGAASGSIQLGRAWDESQQDIATYTRNVATGVYPNGQALVRQSPLGAHIAAAPWRSAATTNRPFNPEAGALPANRLYEYANTGPGSVAP
jgi:pectinesterase